MESRSPLKNAHDTDIGVSRGINGSQYHVVTFHRRGMEENVIIVSYFLKYVRCVNSYHDTKKQSVMWGLWQQGHIHNTCSIHCSNKITIRLPFSTVPITQACQRLIRRYWPGLCGRCLWSARGLRANDYVKTRAKREFPRNNYPT